MTRTAMLKHTHTTHARTPNTRTQTGTREQFRVLCLPLDHRVDSGQTRCHHHTRDFDDISVRGRTL